MVITRRTRNPLAFRGPWVRIPPAPPSKKLFAFFGKELFAWKDLSSGVFPAYAPSPHLFCSGGRYPPAVVPYPQPVNKAQNALPEIRRAVHHSRALPSDPPPMYIDACPSGTPQRKGKIPERDLAAARYMEISAPSCVNSNRSHISTSRSSKRYLLPTRDSPPLSPACISFTVTSSDSIAASADDRALRSHKKFSAVSYPT